MFGMAGTELWDQLTEETNIYFAKDTYQEISRKETEKVIALTQQIRADPTTFVTVVGHASGEGDDNHNQRLSENRAMKVKALLLAYGVEGKHIWGARGAGSSEKSVPEVGSNQRAVEDQRRKNRRVHVIFHNDPSRPLVLVKPGDIWDKITKLPIPGWPPGKPPTGPSREILNWDKLSQQQKVDEYEKLKKDVQEACEKAFFLPGPHLDKLKDILFPGPANEGPFDQDFHKGRDRE
jgi:hypothetical protein